MPKLELKRKSELSRDEAAEQLIALGRALAGGSETELGSEGDSLSILVADRVRWELEIEVDGDEVEVEIEISWRDTPSRKPADEAPAATERAKAPRRARPRKSSVK
ncbi:amphi-Trp domain-containing protein [Nocardia sp. NPDC019395]|uniref:amphi-Trp domain-containing protein n=1 Tax=Nocardia sp. NPDC019395 TaxID=3154686 RepID=UPI0033DC85AA